jgi:hypothetical protein
VRYTAKWAIRPLNQLFNEPPALCPPIHVCLVSADPKYVADATSAVST